MTRTVVIAIGGNSLIADDSHQSVADQYEAAAETCVHIASMLKAEDLRLVVTHGNGPQVGFILRRSELAAQELHMVPLDSCVADTQGALGYHLQRAMRNEFKRRGVNRTPATVVTQVLVDRADPAFAKPNKPIGSFMSAAQADEHRAKDGWDLVEDAGRGFRRVVASPRPQAILELEAIKSLLDAGFVVVAGGGGGIPVVEDAEGRLTGAAAVIDKDLASSLMARQLGAELLIISTAVEQVCLDFGKPTQRALAKMDLAEARRYIAEGHFKPGSMLPKIEAVVAFLEGGGREALITDPAHLAQALRGETGTRIVP
ncbi:carbamate kinase [Mesoterricola silvestris]|uniref:Carbamate kinase n=1 Tax=Mesoterricola silvestris TaxID=2927979 RepID=A0AA48K7U8_9BACT|nr:carbamate kinase [Mesoterricola silvestris]BDU71480.1 carbamate kinase [Mesoterricola silvestris]